MLAETRLLEDLIAAALQAGAAIRQIYAHAFAVNQKSDSSPVTAADHAAEAVILERLAQIAPAVPVIAEEEVAAGRVPAHTGEFFLVDPLDGTKEFVARRPEFTVNIALVRQGRPVMGVVYAPAARTLYAGEVLAGRAFSAHAELTPPAAGERHSIKVRTAPKEGLTIVVSRSHADAATEAYLERYAVRERVATGSSLKFCLVAAGVADLYPRLGPTMEWDTAAGHAVLLAAGGTVSAAGGGALHYGKPGFLNGPFIASGNAQVVPLNRPEEP